MTEYIDRDAAKLALAREFAFHSYAGVAACAVVDKIPAADVVERKTGKWKDKGHDNIYQCSVCGDLWMGIGGYRFCPNCGADMREP